MAACLRAARYHPSRKAISSGLEEFARSRCCRSCGWEIVDERLEPGLRRMVDEVDLEPLGGAVRIRLNVWVSVTEAGCGGGPRMARRACRRTRRIIEDRGASHPTLGARSLRTGNEDDSSPFTERKMYSSLESVSDVNPSPEPMITPSIPPDSPDRIRASIMSRRGSESLRVANARKRQSCVDGRGARAHQPLPQCPPCPNSTRLLVGNLARPLRAPT
jgi:hypothetical protein